MREHRHGSPYDRGSADYYYWRGYNPHYYEGASYSSKRVSREEMTLDQVREYARGYADAEAFGDRKSWE